MSPQFNAMVAQNKQKLRLQENQFHELRLEVLHAIAASRSGTETINELIAELAQLMEVPIEAVRWAANKGRTRHYNQIVDDSLCQGMMEEDPRENATRMSQREWYTP